MQKLGKSKSWIVTAVLAGIALAYLFFVYFPGQKKIAQTHEELRDLRQLIIDANHLAPAIVRMEGELEKAEEFTTSWRKNSPQENQLAALLGSISHQCELTGAEMIRMAPQGARKYETIQEIPLGVTIEGSYQQMFEFLQRMEKLPERVITHTIQIRSTGENGKRLRCELDLKIFTDNPDKTG